MSTRIMTAQRRQDGFTMIEIALAVAIVAFAMAAIMGVLPMGLQVQKENRDDTLINQEGNYLLEAIRTGAVGMDDLTNYVDWIAITNQALWGNRPFLATNYTYTGSGYPKLWNGEVIIGLLSNPRALFVPNRGWTTNTVVGKFRTMSGNAAEKNRTAAGMAFSYLARVDIQQYMPFPLNYAPTNYAITTVAADKVARNALFRQGQFLAGELYEVRLTLSWPVLPNGTTGSGQRVFRTLVSGRWPHLTDPNFPYYTNLYFLYPNYYGP